MIEEPTQKTQETTPQLSQEEQLEQLYKVSSMRHKALGDLMGNYIDYFSSIMVSSNGVSFQKKLEAAQALKEAVKFAFDFGLNVSKAKIRQSGNLAKETNGLAGVMVQALDTRFLLLADKLKKDEEQQNTQEVINE